jgi:DNA-directed RNA polymerase omega subunit
MSSKYHSRHEQLDVEKCVKQSGGNKFDLIIMAANRGREIKQQNQHSKHMEHHHGVVTALLEIQSGTVDPNWCNKVK